MKKIIFIFVIPLMLLNCQEKKGKEQKIVKQMPTGEMLVVEASQLLGRNGCLGCHSEDGTRLVGPTFKGIWGRKTKLNTGDEIIIDSAYVVRSIINSSADIVEGYLPGQMPNVALKQEELDLIIRYLKTL